MERADENGRQLLQAMEDEHGEIDPILEAVAAGLARLAATADADTKAALVVRLCAGKESLARHLAHEETEAIALVQQVMTDAEWRGLEEEHFKKGVKPRTVIRLLPWAMHRQPAAVTERLVADAPIASAASLVADPTGLRATRATSLPPPVEVRSRGAPADRAATARPAGSATPRPVSSSARSACRAAERAAPLRLRRPEPRTRPPVPMALPDPGGAVLARRAARAVAYACARRASRSSMRQTRRAAASAELQPARTSRCRTGRHCGSGSTPRPRPAGRPAAGS